MEQYELYHESVVKLVELLESINQPDYTVLAAGVCFPT
uniref:DUF4089 domain-containing protein n=1 Tax=Heterorhabditis bacteriophora TaxID=37862 RepID=A0A1I7XSN5_HETBA